MVKIHINSSSSVVKRQANFLGARDGMLPMQRCAHVLCELTAG